jgi:hypothetical protein
MQKDAPIDKWAFINAIMQNIKQRNEYFLEQCSIPN